jgi:hypothetical protein
MGAFIRLAAETVFKFTVLRKYKIAYIKRQAYKASAH